MLEMIRTGIASKEKKATKLARAKLGTHRRACLKRDEMNNLIQSQRRKNWDAFQIWFIHLSFTANLYAKTTR